MDEGDRGGARARNRSPSLRGTPTKSAEALTIQSGDGGTVAHRRGRPIFNIFRKPGVFQPKIVRCGAEPELFPFAIEELRRETLRERLQRPVKSAKKLVKKQQRVKRLKKSAKPKALKRRVRAAE